MAEAEFEYRRLERYKLAAIEAEIGKPRPSDGPPQEGVRAEAFLDSDSILRVVRVLEKLDRYDIPRWNQLRRALTRYEVVEVQDS